MISTRCMVIEIVNLIRVFAQRVLAQEMGPVFHLESCDLDELVRDHSLSDDKYRNDPVHTKDDASVEERKCRLHVRNDRRRQVTRHGQNRTDGCGDKRCPMRRNMGGEVQRKNIQSPDRHTKRRERIEDEDDDERRGYGHQIGGLVRCTSDGTCLSHERVGHCVVGIRWGASSLTMEFVLTAGADPMISMADECHENYKAKRWNWRSLSCRGGPVGDQTTSKTLSLRDKEVGSEPPRLGIRCFGPAWSQRHRDGETCCVFVRDCPSRSCLRNDGQYARTRPTILGASGPNLMEMRIGAFMPGESTCSGCSDQSHVGGALLRETYRPIRS